MIIETNSEKRKHLNSEKKNSVENAKARSDLYTDRRSWRRQKPFLHKGLAAGLGITEPVKQPDL